MHVSRIGFTTSGWVLACSHHVTLLHCNHLLAGSRFVIFEGLEPYEVKVSRTVLRGPGAGNRSRLPGAPAVVGDRINGVKLRNLEVAVIPPEETPRLFAFCVASDR